jgi:glutamyl-tRNA reductase
MPTRSAEFDIVITGTAPTLPILGKGLIERAIKVRRHRPMFIVDFAVPRDVEPDVKSLPDVFLYTIDELGRIVQEGAESRREATVEAEAIVTREVEAFRVSQAARSAVPADRRAAPQGRAVPRGGARQGCARASPAARIRGRCSKGLAKGLANKFLHHPMQALSRAPTEERAALERAIEKLYPDAGEA